jgi:hypothetical protein
MPAIHRQRRELRTRFNGRTPESVALSRRNIGVNSASAIAAKARQGNL